VGVFVFASNLSHFSVVPAGHHTRTSYHTIIWREVVVFRSWSLPYTDTCLANRQRQESSHKPPKLQVLLMYLAHEDGGDLCSEPLPSPLPPAFTYPLLPVCACVLVVVTWRSDRLTAPCSWRSLAIFIVTTIKSSSGSRQRRRRWRGRGRGCRRRDRRRRRGGGRKPCRGGCTTAIPLVRGRRLALLLRQYSVVHQHEGVAVPLPPPCRGGWRCRRAAADGAVLMLGMLAILLATETLGFHVLRYGRRGGVWYGMGSGSHSTRVHAIPHRYRLTYFCRIRLSIQARLLSQQETCHISHNSSPFHWSNCCSYPAMHTTVLMVNHDTAL